MLQQLKEKSGGVARRVSPRAKKRVNVNRVTGEPPCVLNRLRSSHSHSNHPRWSRPR